MKEKIEDKGSFRWFCKQLWKELNENIWGKAILLVGAILVIGNIIIKIAELGRIVDLVFNIPLMVLGLYLTIMYTAKVLHQEEKLLSKKEKEEKERFQEEVKKLNELSRKNPQPLIDWLEEAEQIPEEGESVDEFIKRTDWTLEKENEWRKVDGLPLLKSEEEYRKLFEK